MAEAQKVEINPAFKCCCPPCAVASHEGVGPNCAIACCLGCWFTMFCWTPKPKEGAGPTQQEMTDAPKQQEMA